MLKTKLMPIGCDIYPIFSTGVPLINTKCKFVSVLHEKKYNQKQVESEFLNVTTN